MKDFYSGFEGEPELRFVLRIDGMSQDSLRVWEGYFDSLMEAALPGSQGWSGLALPYHLHSGWYAESPWRVPDTAEAAEEWRRIPTAGLSVKCQEVYDSVMALFEAALNNERSEVWIYYE